MSKKNIPVLIMAGMFFFSIPVQADLLDLATDLFEQGEWSLCRRECQRALLAAAVPAGQTRTTKGTRAPELDRMPDAVPGFTPAARMARFQLLDALCEVHMQIADHETAARLNAIAAQNVGKELSALASYAAGRLQWQFDQPDHALPALASAFQATTNKTLFLRSACSLFLLLKEYPALKQGRSDLELQINTTRTEWYGALFKECAKPDPSRPTPRTPNWIVRFYRTQISPAIGNRCTLEPSCSEYFHKASVKHGLKAIPMIADRFVREPEVSNTRADPVVMSSGRIFYRDPLENHDFWMNNR